MSQKITPISRTVFLSLWLWSVEEAFAALLLTTRGDKSLLPAAGSQAKKSWPERYSSQLFSPLLLLRDQFPVTDKGASPQDAGNCQRLQWKDLLRALGNSLPMFALIKTVRFLSQVPLRSNWPRILRNFRENSPWGGEHLHWQTMVTAPSHTPGKTAGPMPYKYPCMPFISW